jgi:eukaryotic-like serine/threonine-protein kinase
LATFIRKYITGRPLWVNILVALILSLIIILGFVLSLNSITQHGVARSVPLVVGKNLDKTRTELEAKDFEVVVQDSVYYDSLAPSVIVKQVPEADAVVKVNRTIYVTVNRVVPPDVDMPNLVGYSFRNAEGVLKNLGLKLGDTTNRADFAKNSVLEQTYKGESITPGTKLKIGSRISLVVGSGIGNEDMPVPKLVGLTLNEAKVLLEAQGLILGPVIPAPMVRDTGAAYVVRQSPAPENEQGKRFRIRPGQMVDLWLDVEPPVADSTKIILTPQTGARQ